MKKPKPPPAIAPRHHAYGILHLSHPGSNPRPCVALAPERYSALADALARVRKMDRRLNPAVTLIDTRQRAT